MYYLEETLLGCHLTNLSLFPSITLIHKKNEFPNSNLITINDIVKINRVLY